MPQPSYQFFLLCLCSILAGCASERDRRQSITSSALNDGAGIVFLSASGDRPCKDDSSGIFIEKKGGTHAIVLVEGGVFANNGRLPSDFGNRIGWYDAFRLQPGDYQLFLHTTGYGYRNPVIAEFHIDAGEAKYLGEITLSGCATVNVSLVDQWEDVRSKATTRYPESVIRRVKLDIQRVPSTGAKWQANRAAP